MKKQSRLAVSAGVTFGIVTIFLFLIGFTSVSGDLLADLFGNKNAAPFLGLTPQTINMLIFLTLIGLWAGSYGSRKIKDQKEDPWAPALIGGLIAGLVHGLLIGLLALLVGTLNQNHVPINMYLASVLPASIKMFLLGGSPVQGAIFHLVLFTLTGFLGGLLSRGVARGSWRVRAGANWKNAWDRFNQKPFIKQARVTLPPVMLSTVCSWCWFF